MDVQAPRLQQPIPITKREYFLASINHRVRAHIPEQILSSNIWPPFYNPPSTNPIYRTISCLVFCSTWQVPAGIIATLLSTVAIIVSKKVGEWKFGIFLAICSWLPFVLIWVIAIRMVGRATLAVREVWREEVVGVLTRAARGRETELQMIREFNAEILTERERGGEEVLPRTEIVIES